MFRWRTVLVLAMIALSFCPSIQAQTIQAHVKEPKFNEGDFEVFNCSIIRHGLSLDDLIGELTCHAATSYRHASFQVAIHNSDGKLLDVKNLSIQNLKPKRKKAFKVIIPATTPDDAVFTFSFNSGTAAKSVSEPANAKAISAEPAAEEPVPSAAEGVAEAGPIKAFVKPTVSDREKPVTATLRRVPVTFGDIASDGSIVRKGKFTDKAATYTIKDTKDQFYLLSDGTNEGWVFKSAIAAAQKPTLLEKSPTKAQTTKHDLPPDFRPIVKAMKAKGFYGYKPWSTQDQVPGWSALSRVYNYSRERNWLAEQKYGVPANETGFRFFGTSKGWVTEVVIQAEIYDQRYANVTLDNGAQCLEILGAPKKVVEAFRGRRKLAFGEWQVEAATSATGFDVICTMSIPGVLFSQQPIDTYVKTKPNKLWKALDYAGFTADIAWRKSRVEDEWLAIWRIFNVGKFGQLTPKQVIQTNVAAPNEVNVQAYGPNQNQITKVVIEAEFYNRADTVQTLGNAIRCFKTLGAPAEVLDAFLEMKAGKQGPWEIKMIPHKPSRGFSVECIYTID